MHCDNSLNEACEMLGSFELIEEVINSVFGGRSLFFFLSGELILLLVFIIRFAERRIDQLLDACVLDYAPHGSHSETVQFESEWSFLRPFVKKKVPSPLGVQASNTGLVSPDKSRNNLVSSPTTSKFSSLQKTIARAHAAATNTPLGTQYSDYSSTPSPWELTAFLTALQTLLVFSDINPLLTTQLWSQVFYWTSCKSLLRFHLTWHLTAGIAGEVFNRVITRKKYLCRSRAIQISANLAVIEDWVDELALPPGVLSHFTPVKDLLSWLQVGLQPTLADLSSE